MAGALLRLLFFHLRPEVAGDALLYGDLAHNIVAHHIYGFSGKVSGISGAVIQPTLIRLPGYPLFLAACLVVFGSLQYVAAIWIQMAVDLAGCALLGVLAERLAGKRAGLMAVWLAALCPFTANYSVVVLAESLSVFCVVVALVALERWDAQTRVGARAWGWVVAIGCALSGAVLLRPDEGILAAAIVSVMLWVGLRRKGGSLGRRVAPAVAASLLVVLPLMFWAARNWRVFHVIQPLAPRYATDPGERIPLGFQRWYRTWAIDFASTEDAYWNYDNAAILTSDLPTRAFDSEEQYERTDELLSEYNRSFDAKPEFDARFAELARERVQADPIRYYVALPVARLLNMAFRPRTEKMAVPLEWWKWREYPGQAALASAFGALNLVYFALGAVGLWLWRRRGWGANAPVVWAMLAFVVLRCALLLTLDNSEPRYTLEFFPLLMLWGSYVFRA